MRINIYGEEITSESVLVSTREIPQDDGGTTKFYGVRAFLLSTPALHHTEDNDDRSAFTLWVPWTREGGYKVSVVSQLLRNMIDDLESVPF